MIVATRIRRQVPESRWLQCQANGSNVSRAPPPTRERVHAHVLEGPLLLEGWEARLVADVSHWSHFLDFGAIGIADAPPALVQGGFGFRV